MNNQAEEERARLWPDDSPPIFGISPTIGVNGLQFLFGGNNGGEGAAERVDAPPGSKLEPRNTAVMSSSMLDWFLSTLTPTPTESHMPSTAEIIQKCLNVNPFDLKFREANMQISGQSAESSIDPNVTQLNIPTTPAGLNMLKLPSSLAQSPSIFSNLNALNAAELESGLRKTMDIQRKVQQLRENAGFVKQEGNKTPCTADVLNAVLDMNMNQMGNGPISIPSTSSLVAGLAAAASSVASSSNLLEPSAAANSSTSNSAADLPNPPTVSVTAVESAAPERPSTSHVPEAAALADRNANGDLLQTSNISNMISHPTALNALTTSVNHSMPNLHSSFPSNPPPSGPASNGLLNSRASPGLSVVSPRANANTLTKHPVGSTSESWESNDVKPLIAKPIHTYGMYDGLHNHLELNTNLPSDSSVSSSQPNSHVSNVDGPSKPRKYASSNESQTTQGSGRGRGRRSLTSDMLPDERRLTILERNKAAAVRYRKRKKEEHDEMIGRVHTLEQDKVFLQTQNSVLRREVDRLTELLKMRDARCICRAANGLALFSGPESSADCPSGALDAEGAAKGALDHGQFLLQNGASQTNL